MTAAAVMLPELDTAQKVFDHVVAHLAKQETPATNRHGCVYIDHDTGKRCAVGACFDERGATWLEDNYGGLAVDDFSIDNVEFRFGDLLSDLQGAHDNNHRIHVLKDELYEIASKYGLDDSKVEEIVYWYES